MRQRVWIVIAAIAAVSLAAGSGGFSAAEIDRGVSISVADSESAYVSLYDPGSTDRPTWAPNSAAREPPVTPAGDRVPVVYVYNRFPESTLTVTIDQPDGSETLSDTESVRIPSGETRPIHATVECVGDREDVELTVVAESREGSVSAQIDFEVTVDCRPPSTETPTPA